MTRLRTAVLLDLDGTAVQTDHIMKYGYGPEQDLDTYHSLAQYCEPNMDIILIMMEWRAAGVPVIVSTARSQRYRGVTDQWLQLYFPDYEDMFMRGNDDERADYLVKQDLLYEIQAKGYYILKAYDDNPTVLDMYNRNSIATYSVLGGSHAASQSEPTTA